MALEVRMLGALSVSHDDGARLLPASRKVRALLAYLAISPRAVSRRHLCELLWDAPSDPRGELRWCLSKLRGLLGSSRLVSCGDAVRLDLGDGLVDVLELERAAKTGFDAITIDRARELLAMFRGELLEGLEIERCPAFTSWLLAQRRRHGAWRIALLRRLVESVAVDDALPYIEQWLELAPFDESAHERLFYVLARSRRLRDGDAHLAATLASFSAEGVDGAPLRKAWSLARAAPAARSDGRAGDGAQAYEYYLEGRQHLGRMMRQGLETGREKFLLAIELDPACAPAWAGLATAHACLNEWFGTGAAGLAKARQTSRMALQLAPQLADAHVARGLAKSLSHRYDEARTAFEEAIRLDPYSFDAHYFFARTSFAFGDARRASELYRLAAELREEDFQSPLLLGLSLRALGRRDAAHEAERMGIIRAEQALARDPSNGRALSLAAGSLFENGEVERAMAWSRRSLELHPDDASAMVNAACLQTMAGCEDAALGLLERVFAQGCGKRDWVAHDPDYAPLRDDPRFQRLVANLD